MIVRFIILFLIPFTLLAKTIELSHVDFDINPSKIRDNIYYSLHFYSYKDQLPEVLKQFDVENFKNQKTMMVYSKSVFMLNKDSADIDQDDFVDPVEVAKVFAATHLATVGEQQWKFQMKVAIKKVNFRISTEATDYFSDNSLAGLYATQADIQDTTLNPYSFYITQILDQFSEGIKRMVIVSKIIPYGDKTLVVSYHLSALDYRWFKKYNFFHAVEKVMKKKVLSTLSRTKRLMGR
jgi:hypothetical protein